MGNRGFWPRTVGFVLLSTVICIGFANSRPTSHEAVQTLTYYFDLLVSGNLESARGLWTASAVERSGRFGIVFENIPLKLDCSSPVVRNLPVMRDHLYRSARRAEELPGGEYYMLEYSAVVEGEKVTHPYYAYYDGDYFWLTYPQDYYGYDWPIVETDFFRIHCHPDMVELLHPLVKAEADQYVETTAEALGIPRRTIADMRQKKIEYFYCRSDTVVQEITGHRVKGMLDLASNDLISAFFPHFHELAHLLVNIRLQQLPLNTVPLLREGIAVHLGGRWGKTPVALGYLGGFLLDQGIVALDSILTVPQFDKHATADMAYPVAGLFTSFIIDQVGLDRYLETYRALSGPYDSLFNLTPQQIESVLTAAMGSETGSGLREQFHSYVRSVTMDNAPFAPGAAVVRGKTLLDTETLHVEENREWLGVSVTAGQSGAESPVGTLLFGRIEDLVGKRSLLYEEQRQSPRVLEGFRYGVRFDGNEAGLYDYVTNQLLAKYIWGLTPSDAYHDEDQKTIEVKFRKELCDGTVPRRGDYLLILE